MTTILLDTHVVIWWASESSRLSAAAIQAIESADALSVSGITWFELAWLSEQGRIRSPMPVRAWLDQLAENIETVSITPAIAATAVALLPSFPSDPADRLIYATAIERGWPLVTKDEQLRRHRHARTTVIW